NEIDLQLNFKGSAAGEVTPAGIVASITAMANGATTPSLTTPLSHLADLPFRFIASGYNDATSLGALTAFMNDVSGRWSWAAANYGHVFAGYKGSFGSATTFGLTLNDQHLTVMPFNASPTPSWKWAAAIAAQAAISVRADQAQPIRGVALQHVLAPTPANRYTLSQRDTLLHDGLSTFTVDPAGNVLLSKVVTTYQLNTQGVADNSYLDVETMFNLAGVLDALRGVVTSKYARSKLAADGTRLLPGSAVVTPNIIKADLIATYREMEAQGFVQQSDIFAEGLVVQKNTSNPNRVDVLWPGVLIDRLDIFALLAQFRLQ
ncbi:MAG: phage tail sheath subtilisin-like domain-containing protein, partial [Proteobacteria bacterium]|nr:phage tail sheath subtilisin-like domain-containing protein [Pseudomonadota bacterium]